MRTRDRTAVAGVDRPRRHDRRGGPRGRRGWPRSRSSRGGPAAAIALFLLAIVIAAVAGGLSAGLIAAMLSSMALPFLYGAPRFRLRLDGTEEVVTAVVFLAVAWWWASWWAARPRNARARRVANARPGCSATCRRSSLTGEVPDRVLDDFATVLLEPFGLARCEITVELDGTPAARRWRQARRDARWSRRGGPAGGGHRGVRHAQGGASRRQAAVHARRAQLLEAARQAGRRRARPRAAGRPGAARTARRRDEPAPGRDVQLGDPRPAHAARLDQGGRDEPARPHACEYEPEQETELLTTILEETDRLNRLVGNILDLARDPRGGARPRRRKDASSTRSSRRSSPGMRAAAWTGCRRARHRATTCPTCRSTGCRWTR